MNFPVNSTSFPYQNSSYPMHHPMYMNQGFGQPHMIQHPPQPLVPQQPEKQLQQRLLPQPQQPQPPQPRERIEMQRDREEDVLIVQLERSLFPWPKPRIRWTKELHARFLRAVVKLGGLFRATPKAILKKMNVEGVTRSHIKSHLQKLRTTNPSGLSAEELTRIQNSSHSRASQVSEGVAYSTGGLNMNAPSSHPDHVIRRDGFQSFDADIHGHGRLLGSYETPNYRPNPSIAPSNRAQHKDGGFGSSK